MSLQGAQVGGAVFVYDATNGARSGRSGEELPVVKVTKQTVYAEQYGKRMAFDVNTGYQKQDAYCHHRAWLTKAEFEEERDLDREWGEFRRTLPIGRPKHLTLEQMQLMRRLIEVWQELA